MSVTPSSSRYHVLVEVCEEPTHRRDIDKRGDPDGDAVDKPEGVYRLPDQRVRELVAPLLHSKKRHHQGSRQAKSKQTAQR